LVLEAFSEAVYGPVRLMFKTVKWNTGSAAQRFRDTRKKELNKILKELLKINPYYYDSIYEYLKDVHESTKKIKK